MQYYSNRHQARATKLSRKQNQTTARDLIAIAVIIGAITIAGISDHQSLVQGLL